MDTPLGLIVSELIYNGVVKHGYPGIVASDDRPVCVTAKETRRAPAWIWSCLAGRPVPSSDGLRAALVGALDAGSGRAAGSAGVVMPDPSPHGSARRAIQMVSLFLSHSSSDQEVVDRIADRLRAAGFHSLFVDYDPLQGIPAGRNWERELYSQLRRADAVVFVASAASVESRWCFAELALARSQGKPVFPVRVGGSGGHPLLGDIQWVDLDGEGEAAFTRLWSSFRRHGLDPHDSFGWDAWRPPYPGLTSFQPADAAVFFGRDDAVGGVLERLRGGLRQGLARCLSIVGSSGSGKSSLVRAGVIPRLRRLDEQWVITDPFAPGSAPLAALARTLAVALDGSTSRRREFHERIRQEPRELVELARDLSAAAGGSQHSVLLVVDQAEELITTAAADECAQLAAALQEGLRSDKPLSILLTLRSEFIGAFSQHPELAGFVVHPLVLGPLDRSRLPEVIEGPARLAGLRFAPGLVQRMVEDTRGGDALPLLSYTLQQLHERRKPDGLITAESYAALGGVPGALRTQADRVAAVVRQEHGDIVVPTMLKLVTVDSGNDPAGRNVTLGSLSADERAVVDRFVEERLLVTRDEPSTGDAVVGIAHEALLRAWPPLRHAIEASREDLRTRGELERLAQDWDAAGRQDSYLLRADRLARAEQWLEGSLAASELPLVVEFLERSKRRDQTALRRESILLAQRALDQMGSDPERGILLGLAAVEEYAPTPRAILALNTALQESRVRGYLRGHSEGLNSVVFSPDGARVLTASEDGTARVWDPRDGRELLVLRGHEGGVMRAGFAPDGRRIVTASKDATARVWDADDGRELLVLRGHTEYVTAATYSPDGAWIVTACFWDGTIRLWDAVDGRLLQESTGGERMSGFAEFTAVAFSPLGGQFAAGRSWSQDVYSPHVKVFQISKRGKLKTAKLLERHDAGPFHSVGYSPDGDRIIAAADGASSNGGTEGIILVWDADSGDQVLEFKHEEEVSFVDFSPSGEEIVAGTEDGLVLVVDASDGKEMFELAGHTEPVTWAACSPDGSSIATASGDGTARLWDGTASWGAILAVDHDAPVHSAVFSPDGTRIVTASREDPTVKVWDAASGRQLLVLRGHREAVYSAVFSPDGTRIVTASADETLKMWDAATGAETAEIGGYDAPAYSVVFSPDGTRIAAGLYTPGGEASVRIWDASNRYNLHSLATDAEPGMVAFSPDGTRVVSGAGNGTVRVWAAESGRKLLELPHDEAVNAAAFSPDGQQITTVSQGGPFRVWDAASGREVLKFGGLDRESDYSMVGTVSYSPDGRRILTATGGSTVRVWDAVTGEELLTVSEASPVTSAMYSPDGTRIVTAADDGTARVWEDSPLRDLVRRARQRVFRSLTAAERQEYGLPPADR